SRRRPTCRRRSSRELRRENVQRIAHAGEIVLNALLHQGRAMVAFPRLQLVEREPMQGDDLFVERTVLVQGTGLAREAEAEERDVLCRVVPAVDGHQRTRLE